MEIIPQYNVLQYIKDTWVNPLNDKVKDRLS